MTTPLRRASDEQRTNVAVPIFALRTHDTAMLDRPTTLYRYFAAGGELLYVGITGRATDRAEMHRRLTKWWPFVAYATYEHFPSQAAAAAAETRAILDEKPSHNIARVPGAPRRRRLKTELVRIAPQLSPEESLALVETLDARVEMRRLFRILAILEWPDL